MWPDIAEACAPALGWNVHRLLITELANREAGFATALLRRHLDPLGGWWALLEFPVRFRFRTLGGS
jgi:hypothetical protein